MNKNYCLNNQIQLIKSEIEKKIKECQEIFISSPDCFAKYQHIDGRIHAYTYILDFINSISQESSEDLEEEIIHFNEWMKCNGLTLSTSTIAHYFANWGAEHL